MKSLIALTAVALAIAGSATTANAAGCASGAVAGAIVGHVAGSHGVAGAAGGCAVGHYEKIKQQRANAPNNQQPASTTNPTH